MTDKCARVDYSTHILPIVLHARNRRGVVFERGSGHDDDCIGPRPRGLRCACAVSGERRARRSRRQIFCKRTGFAPGAYGTAAESPDRPRRFSSTVAPRRAVPFLRSWSADSISATPSSQAPPRRAASPAVSVDRRHRLPAAAIRCGRFFSRSPADVSNTRFTALFFVIILRPKLYARHLCAPNGCELLNFKWRPTFHFILFFFYSTPFQLH